MPLPSTTLWPSRIAEKKISSVSLQTPVNVQGRVRRCHDAEVRTQGHGRQRLPGTPGHRIKQVRQDCLLGNEFGLTS